MKKVVKKTLVVSSVSAAVIAVIALIVNQRVNQQPVKSSIRWVGAKSNAKKKEVFRDDNDLGYC